MARHYPSEGVKPAENKREAGPKEKKSETPKFQSTRPMRGATAKVYKITLHTFATKGNS